MDCCIIHSKDAFKQWNIKIIFALKGTYSPLGEKQYADSYNIA